MKHKKRAKGIYIAVGREGGENFKSFSESDKHAVEEGGRSQLLGNRISKYENVCLFPSPFPCFCACLFTFFFTNMFVDCLLV